MRTRALPIICLLGLLLALMAGGAAAQEEKPEAEGYGVRRPGRSVARPDGMPLGATGIHAKPVPQGYVDVLCERDAMSLPDCLQRARDSGRGYLDLPPGVGLEHVAGLFERGLKYYDLHEDFARYRGFRFVMRFRGLTQGELEEREQQRGAALGAGVAGGAALSVVAPLVPLTPIIFLFDSASAESDLNQVREDAEARGVPPPNRGSFAATYQDYENTYRGYMEGSLTKADEQGVYGAFEITQCAIMRPREREAQTPQLRKPAPLPGEEAQDAQTGAALRQEPVQPSTAPQRVDASPMPPVHAEPVTRSLPAVPAEESRESILDAALKAAAQDVEARERTQAAAPAAPN